MRFDAEGRDPLFPESWLLPNTPEAEGVTAALDERIAILAACAIALDWLHFLL